MGRRSPLPLPGHHPVLRVASGRLLTSLATSEPTIRPTVPDDLPAIGEIYAHHVRSGVATFETTPPDQQEWIRRFHAVADAGLPFVTAEIDGAIAGFAYCVQWKSRPAYRHTVEDSIYVAPDTVGRFPCVAPQSGFVDGGRLIAVGGFKHGRWLDTVLLQRSIN